MRGVARRGWGSPESRRQCPYSSRSSGGPAAEAHVVRRRAGHDEGLGARSPANGVPHA